MIGTDLLDLATVAALNLHGSMLPRYRGRAPVNWVLLHGEEQTGVTLHHMDAKPDHGDIVAQRAVRPLDEVLHRFLGERVRLAAVVGPTGWVGIVSLEDVLEELVGDIRDETDPAIADPSASDPGSPDLGEGGT